MKEPQETIGAVRGQLGEVFDDYVIIARRRSLVGEAGCQDAFYYSFSDQTWASGALHRLSVQLDDGYHRRMRDAE